MKYVEAKGLSPRETSVASALMANGPRSRKNSSTLWQRVRRNWQLYVLLILPLIWLIVFRYAPMYGAQIAFRQYSPAFGIEGSPWVGLANFVRFFNSPKCEPVIVNTLVISFY